MDAVVKSASLGSNAKCKTQVIRNRISERSLEEEKMNKRTLTVGLALVLCWGFISSLQAADKVKVGTSLRGSPIFSLPMLAAEGKGTWRKHGLEVEWIPFSGGAAETQALAAGALDVGASEVTGVISSIARGAPIIIIAHMGVTNDFGIWVRVDSPIKDGRDLKGKKIDVLRIGGAAHAYGLAIAKSLGLEGQIRFIGTGGIQEQIAAVKSGAIDGTLTNLSSVAPVAAMGEIREILKIPDYLPRPWVNRVLYARKEFAEKNLEVAGRFVRAYLEAADFVMKNRDWAIEKMVSDSKFSADAAKLAYPMLDYSRDGVVDEKGLANVLQFLLEYGIIPREKTPPLGQIYTPKFTQ